ncbi:helix-turn-helix domain-containing protein [Haloarchaeobius sp. TZWWS8]|uniref:helix-turn-helix domain-containing protein n=1 Tax=Haloarchaeobius sp. TZWWS8 TaxID=3446121 RepID=UPI003EB7C874
MSIVAELSVPADSFALGRTLSIDDNIVVELEEAVPTGDRTIPYFWVRGEDIAGFTETLRADPTVQTVEQHATFENSALFYVEWAEPVESLLYGVSSLDGSILEGVNSADRWTLTVRFPDHDVLARFHEYCADSGIDNELMRIQSLEGGPGPKTYGLTQRQREAMLAALDGGYFDVPRGVTQPELAEQLDISDSAVSELLRRGTAKLVSNTLKDPY